MPRGAPTLQTRVRYRRGRRAGMQPGRSLAGVQPHTPPQAEHGGRVDPGGLVEQLHDADDVLLGQNAGMARCVVGIVGGLCGVALVAWVAVRGGLQRPVREAHTLRCAYWRCLSALSALGPQLSRTTCLNSLLGTVIYAC